MNRRFSVPITAEDNYVKPYLLLSVAFFPLWFVGYYLQLYDYMLGADVQNNDDDDGNVDIYIYLYVLYENTYIVSYNI